MKRSVRRECCVCFALLLLVVTVRAEPPATVPQPAASPKRSTKERQRINEVALKSFAATHDGWSADEVVLNEELNKAFLQACQAEMENIPAAEWNWTLLNLRKAGKLDVKATRRRTDRHDDYLHAAEIAARFAQDKFATTIDRVMCDADQRAEFDRVATSIAPEVDAYLLRKAAFGLRKARQLQPELVVRVADWGREIAAFPAEELSKNPIRIPQRPGVYIFRDATGYLYIGESYDLRDRVSKHLDHSDRKSLAHYLWQNGLAGVTVELHSFDPDSKAREKNVRRAYESELIRSREPRLNIAP